VSQNEPQVSRHVVLTDRRTAAPNDVDRYWGEFTVFAKPIRSTEESLANLEWRFGQYPLFREFMRLYGNHEDEVVLDYGCGPGNDVVGFLVHTRARKVIGVDVSSKALSLAAARIALHDIDPLRMDLIQISDTSPTLPLPDASVDYVHSGGVIHHTTDPDAVLRELHRVVRPGGSGHIMVYNQNSIWFHLHAAYVKRILESAFQGLTLKEAFARTTDTEDCPIARCYLPEEFTVMCAEAGFEAEYVGGYLSQHELVILKNLFEPATKDERLPEKHRVFLRSLTYDAAGFPLHRGKHAGLGGVYRLMKASSMAGFEASRKRRRDAIRDAWRGLLNAKLDEMSHDIIQLGRRVSVLEGGAVTEQKWKLGVGMGAAIGGAVGSALTLLALRLLDSR